MLKPSTTVGRLLPLLLTVLAAPVVAQLAADEDGAFSNRGTRHLSRFDRGGAALRVHEPNADDVRRGELKMRLVDWRRGAGGLRAIAPRAPTATADAVDYAHEGVVERYRVTPTGFEQSFVFAHRPAGSGDLVLGVAVHGDVTATARPPRHAPIAFERDGLDAIEYGSAIVLDDGGRQARVQTSYDGGGRIELRVDAAFVDTADYPLVVDPIVGPAITIGTAFFDDTSPAVAHDSSNGGYIAVWTRTFSASSAQIRARIFEADGTPRTGEVALTTTGVNGNPDVAFTAGVFGVVWDTVGGIRGATVHATTGVVQNPTTISTPPIGAYDRRPSIAGNRATTMFVAWDHQPIGANGPRAIRMRSWNTPHLPAMSWVSPTWTLHQVSGGYLRDVRLPGTTDTATDTWPSYEYRARNRAVWETYVPNILAHTDVQSVAFEMRITGSSTATPTLTITDAVSTVPGANSQFVDERSPDIAMLWSTLFYGYCGYCVVWAEHGEVHAHRFDQNAPVGAPFVVRSAGTHAYAPVVGGGVGEFTVAWHEAPFEGASNIDVRAARVLADGTVPIDDRVVDGAGQPLTGRPAISSRAFLPTGLGAQSNRSLVAWSCNTGPSSGPGELSGRLFQPVVSNEQQQGTPCAGPGGTAPTITLHDGLAESGNLDFAVGLSAAPADSLVALLVSPLSQSSVLPGTSGCVLEVGLPLMALLPAVTSATGDVEVDLPLPSSIPHDVLLALQWGVYTPGYNAFGWILSDAIELRFSQL